PRCGRPTGAPAHRLGGRGGPADARAARGRAHPAGRGAGRGRGDDPPAPAPRPGPARPADRGHRRPRDRGRRRGRSLAGRGRRARRRRHRRRGARLGDRPVPSGTGPHARRPSGRRIPPCRRHRGRHHRHDRERKGRLMAKGQPAYIPDDGLTTRQRRNRPLVMVNTGDGKGKSTSAFGLALRSWNQGWSVAVFQFVKSAKWRLGEQTAMETLAELHEADGTGGPIEWHKMGSGWSWSRKAGTEEDHAAQALDGWREIQRRLAAEQHRLYVLDEMTYPIEWGWIDIDEVVETLAN